MTTLAKLLLGLIPSQLSALGDLSIKSKSIVFLNAQTSDNPTQQEIADARHDAHHEIINEEREDLERQVGETVENGL